MWISEQKWVMRRIPLVQRENVYNDKIHITRPIMAVILICHE